mmetsp:Transcript_117300/g.343538  ORF Transcript_117300/g.343538 Transcript_117300/m.343538 type:complete len:296 (+) Transcript_117300:92-979(+)
MAVTPMVSHALEPGDELRFRDRGLGLAEVRVEEAGNVFVLKISAQLRRPQPLGDLVAIHLAAPLLVDHVEEGPHVLLKLTLRSGHRGQRHDCLEAFLAEAAAAVPVGEPDQGFRRHAALLEAHAREEPLEVLLVDPSIILDVHYGKQSPDLILRRGRQAVEGVLAVLQQPGRVQQRPARAPARLRPGLPLLRRTDVEALELHEAQVVPQQRLLAVQCDGADEVRLHVVGDPHGQPSNQNGHHPEEHQWPLGEREEADRDLIPSRRHARDTGRDEHRDGDGLPKPQDAQDLLANPR